MYIYRSFELKALELKDLCFLRRYEKITCIINRNTIYYKERKEGDQMNAAVAKQLDDYTIDTYASISTGKTLYH